MKINNAWFRDTLYELLESAIHFGINRAYKHRDDELPPGVADALVESILRELSNVLDEAIDWESTYE